jgi:hypothetical protein
MGDLNIKELKTDEAKLIRGEWDVSLKFDGTLMRWEKGQLISPRGCNRNARFPHIVKILKENNFRDCIGEMFIVGGNVFDISSSINWSRARYMIFDFLNSEKKYMDRRVEIDDVIDKLDSDFIVKPVRFGSVLEGMNYCYENNSEGLVLRNNYEWKKWKILKEFKIPIKSWEAGKDKGTFCLTTGSRISGTSLAFVFLYQSIVAKGKIAMAEIEAPFVTKDGHLFQPRLRRIFEAEA